ncbi:VWA domain-containing protein [Fulvimarina sp. MAC8]|uniref:VWA domain-containing protein n=1 Tax=Fulvimarina sp. MAC8 TaxID=3162874 RepID=UPI0032EBA7D4
METRFEDRLRLSPLARTAMAILSAAPEIGLVLRAQPGPLRDRFMTELCRSAPWAEARRLAHRDVRTFAAKRFPIAALAGPAQDSSDAPNDDAIGACALILPGTDRYGAMEAAHLIAELGDGHPVIALDEGLGEESLPDALSERIGLWLDLAACEDADAGLDLTLEAGTETRLDTRAITVPETAIATLCEAAAAFGIPSLRAPLHALAAARASAAISGRTEVGDDDILLACRLVLAPRARQAPSFEEPQVAPDDQPEEPDRPPEASNDDAPPEDEDYTATPPDAPDDDSKATGDPDQATDIRSEDVAIPLDLLKQLAAMIANRQIAGKTARKGAAAKSGGLRGRPLGSRAGDPRLGPLDISGTLTAALPWQRFRRQRFARLADRPVILTPSDIRIRRLQTKRETATIFAVDASGSAALARLSEAKGAVERILAECYRRRDRVAMVAFRGTSAETLLPETKSLTRARRALAGLTAGGGTPLASGIALAAELARQSQNQDRTPLIVLLTDGKANIGLDGMAGRTKAKADVEAEAGRLRGEGFASLVIDFSLRPGAAARDLADRLGGRYLALPNGEAAHLADAVAADATKAAR